MSAATQPPGLRRALWRSATVLQAAWRQRRELDGPHRQADELAFLPAAVSLQETPAHPAPRVALWALLTLVALALAWSCWGQLDVVAVAPGRIVVSDRTKIVQPLEAGVVKAIHVRDGDRVQAGQLLIELDPTAAVADHRSVLEQTQATHAERQRAQALLQALDGKPLPLAADVQTQAEWSDISARQARLQAEAQRRQAELQTVERVLAKLNAVLPLARQREGDIQSLAAQGFVAGHAGQDRTRERVELEQDLATQQARLAEAQAALAESDKSLQAYQAEQRRSLNDRWAKARLDAAQLSQQGAKTHNRERLTRLTAPIAGTVQQLAVHTTGGVVTAAQPLMVLVPEQAEVTAEVTLENKDIGFVHEGQRAEVKVDTFNFTRYGLVPATVLRVTPDAVVDEKRGPVYMATVRLERTSLNIDGREVALAPGMTVSAELKLRRRTVMEYLLSPLQRAVQESLGER